MAKAIKEHYEKAEQRQMKITELVELIERNEAELKDKQQAYKASVAAGDDSQTDVLFHEVEALQGRIKADKHKHKTLEEVTAEFIKADAVKVIKGYGDAVKIKHQKKADDALKIVEDAKQAYIQALDIVNGIDEDFKAETSQYFNLIRKRKLSKEDINTGNDHLFYKIEYPAAIIPAKTSLVINGHDIEKRGQ